MNALPQSCDTGLDADPFDAVCDRLILATGRACIHQDHRSFAVLNLLWKGIGQHAKAHGARCLLGCSSLTAQDPAVGAAAWALGSAMPPPPNGTPGRSRPLPVRWACWHSLRRASRARCRGHAATRGFVV